MSIFLLAVDRYYVIIVFKMLEIEFLFEINKESEPFEPVYFSSGKENFKRISDSILEKVRRLSPRQKVTF